LPLYVIEPPDVLQISVTSGDPKNGKSISGNFLVGPDGRVNLKDTCSVYLAGLTLAQAEAAIEQVMAKTFTSPSATIDVSAYNSKKYYVITQPVGAPSAVSEFPITGNDTVLDAVAQVGGIAASGQLQVSVARPAPNRTGPASTLLVNWSEVINGQSDATNYRLQPRDRIIISQMPAATVAN
jgi:protein involved in polysaccharide export with SLBB domain